MNLAAVLTAPASWSLPERNAWPTFAALMLAPYLATLRDDEAEEALANLGGLVLFARVVIGCRALMELLGSAGEEPRGKSARETCAEMIRCAADGLNGASPRSTTRAAVALIHHDDPFSIAEMICDDEHAADYAGRMLKFCDEATRILRTVSEEARHAAA